jgi:hypothetical protein
LVPESLKASESRKPLKALKASDVPTASGG